MELGTLRLTRTIIIASLALLLLAPLHARTVKQKKLAARSQFDTAERLREALNGQPRKQRTRHDYQKVIDAFRKVAPVQTAQSPYNLFERARFENDYIRFYKDYGYGSTTWSPLASGLLTGKYGNGIPKGSRGTLKGYDWLNKHLTDPDKLEARLPEG